jgi:hypothetical protein
MYIVNGGIRWIEQKLDRIKFLERITCERMHEGLDDDPLKTFTRETDLISIETVDTNKKIKI